MHGLGKTTKSCITLLPINWVQLLLYADVCIKYKHIFDSGDQAGGADARLG